MPGYSWVHTGPVRARSKRCEAHVTVRPHGRTSSMSDRYQSLIHTPVGQLLAKNLGLPNPVRLERYHEGDPLVDGPVAIGGAGRLVKPVVAALDELGVAHVQDAAAEQKYKALVFDATAVTSSDRLTDLQDFFTPLLRSLGRCPRIVVLGTPPESTGSGQERVAQ